MSRLYRQILRLAVPSLLASVSVPLIGIADQGDRATHVASVTDGKGGMPAFGERLSADEIKKVAVYVHQLGGGQ